MTQSGNKLFINGNLYIDTNATAADVEDMIPILKDVEEQLAKIGITLDVHMADLEDEKGNYLAGYET